MKSRTIIVVVMALVCGASVAAGVNQLRGGGQYSGSTEMIPIVVAARDVAQGETITAEDVCLCPWPASMATAGLLRDVEEAVDRALLVPLVAREPVFDVKLASKDAGPGGLAVRIPKGMRAYTIQTSRAATSVAGFVLPGNKVDVLLSLKGNLNDETGGGSTTTLLQAVRIVAVDQRLDAPAENKTNPKDLTSVTLLVTPDQAALLDLGQNMGQLTLALRNPSDNGEAVCRPATLIALRGRQEKPKGLEPPAAARKVVPEEPEVGYIATIRGTSQGLVQVALKRPHR